MVTIKDVAKYAGVSLSTVSKYLNAPDDMLPEYYERVKNAIIALDYVPRAYARSMRTNKTRQIALVTASFQSQHSLELLDAVLAEAALYNYSVINLNTNETYDGVEKALMALQSRMVDGAILAYIDYDDEVLPLIQQMTKQIPCVVLTYTPNRIESSNIVINMFEGAFRLGEYLVELGHKKIAFCGGYKDSIYMREKERAYKVVMERHGLEILDTSIVYGESNGLITGYKNAIELLSHAEPPTAIMAANDILAIGCIKATRDSGYRVPNDIAVTGFDGIKMGELYDPAVSTYKQPVDKIAKLAVEMVLERLEDDSNSKDRLVVYKGRVLRRQSTEKDAPSHLLW